MEMGSSPHVLLFPFMSKGHTIPLLHLARLLLRRGASVTIFTTPANLPFISHSLSDTTTSFITLPFPQNIQDVPPGIESTDKLPSISLFLPFVTATKFMKPDFEKALTNLPNLSFMVTDGFFGWTLDSASKFGIPRLTSYGFNMFTSALSRAAVSSGVIHRPETDDELIEIPDFPWIKLTRNDINSPLADREPKGPHFEFIMEQVIATSNSYGVLINSFYEMEPEFVEYWNRECKPKAWCIGPLCLAEPAKRSSQLTPWMEWLEKRSSVLYVAFGSQAEISKEQLQEIEKGLEDSGVNFLWVVGKNGKEINSEFEKRVKERGILVREWVDQREILQHTSVKGFLSHCGWNSVLESICAKVPILGWPMMAEQPLNLRMVVEEIKVGLSVEKFGGKLGAFVKSEKLEKMVMELMEGEMGKMVRKKVEEIGEAAVRAMEEGGSSCRNLNQLIAEIQGLKQGV